MEEIVITQHNITVESSEDNPSMSQDSLTNVKIQLI